MAFGGNGMKQQRSPLNFLEKGPIEIFLNGMSKDIFITWKTRLTASRQNT